MYSTSKEHNINYYYYYYYYYYIITIITAVQLSLGSSSPYTSTDKNK